jgi:hypothetical protein
VITEVAKDFENPTSVAVSPWCSKHPGYGTDLYPALINFCELTGIKPVLP